MKRPSAPDLKFRIRLDRNSRFTLTAQVTEALRQIIAGGVLKPGDRLPSHLELARRLGVSTRVARESFAELAFELDGPAAPVSVGGAFDVRRGAKVTVRIGDALERRGRIPLVRASSIAGELSDVAVTIEGGGRLYANARPYFSNGTFGVCTPSGFTMVFW